ncbi:hypothetical protein SAMD00019534_062530 [Acytostelium subglobosum LB1]|uniref:hypothetical protein n=1 Tax=Acytostelium subglobosum LB1 TaxID=1410327 RepID=UPI000644C22E|nr:hypothetical protein SAMD00019534_062530 [Acytostelium subglobosum LB1]GAM23078.1 hypothetical protein SAMD00019534_062530 [Acytostelium subglobosum LB1]|eukprot:XP_012754305.1 hypothetical protein SAMD00019534_062530 [Acytostelium subglobosum LB1]
MDNSLNIPSIESQFEFEHLETVEKAAANGHIALIEHFIRTRPQYVIETAGYHAARAGQMKVLKYLHALNQVGTTMLFDEYTMGHAASNGQLEAVLFLHHCRTEGCTKGAMDMAAANGHLAVVEFLHANRTEGCSADAMAFAARDGRVDIIKFLYKNRTEGCVLRSLAFWSEGSGQAQAAMVFLYELQCREQCPLCHNSKDMLLYRGFVEEVHDLELRQEKSDY